MPDHICMIQTSAESREQAAMLAEGLLAQRLAACVQIIPGGESLYHWHGKIERVSECYVVAKTRVDLRGAVSDWLARHHPYQTPEIVSQQLLVNPDYASWVRKETRPV